MMSTELLELFFFVESANPGRSHAMGSALGKELTGKVRGDLPKPGLWYFPDSLRAALP